MKKCIYCLPGDVDNKAIFSASIDLGSFGEKGFDLFIYEDKAITTSDLKLKNKKIAVKYCPMCGRKLELNG